jgi:hypothetical protein
MRWKPNDTRGSFYAFKDGDNNRYPPDDFWKAIIDDMS